MKVVLTKGQKTDLRGVVVSGLRGGLRSGDYGAAFRILRAKPEISVDPDVEPILQALLADPLIVRRFDAAHCLALAGRQLGVDHLVYNALAVHPELRTTPSYKFHVYLMPYVHLLGERHVEMLMGDLDTGTNELNCVTLSALEGRIPVEELLLLLDHSEAHVRRRAAYILGWQHHPASMPVLLDWIDAPPAAMELNPVIPAFLSRTAKSEISRLDKLAERAIERDGNGPSLPERSQVLPLAAALMRSLTAASDDSERVAAFRRAFQAEVTQLDVFTGDHEARSSIRLQYPRPIVRLFGRVTLAPSNQGADFASACLKNVERRELSRTNEDFVNALFDEEGLDGRSLLDGRHLGISHKLDFTGREPEVAGALNFGDGVEILYERADYVRHATEWIVDAERFRRQ